MRRDDTEVITRKILKDQSSAKCLLEIPSKYFAEFFYLKLTLRQETTTSALHGRKRFILRSPTPGA